MGIGCGAPLSLFSRQKPPQQRKKAIAPRYQISKLSTVKMRGELLLHFFSDQPDICRHYTDEIKGKEVPASPRDNFLASGSSDVVFWRSSSLLIWMSAPGTTLSPRKPGCRAVRLKPSRKILRSSEGHCQAAAKPVTIVESPMVASGSAFYGCRRLYPY